MNFKRAWTAAIAVLGGVTVAISSFALGQAAEAPAPAAPPPLADYGHLPTIEQAAISPDGLSLAVIVTDGETRQLLVYRLADMKIMCGVNAGKVKLRGVTWAGSHHVLLRVSYATSVMDVIAPKSEWEVTTDYDTDKHKMTPTIQNVEGDVMNVSFGAPMVRMIDGHPFAFIQGVAFVDSQGHIALFKDDLDRGRTTVVDSGFLHTRDWVVDAAGHPLAELERDPVVEQTRIKVRKGYGWQPVPLGEPNQSMGLLGLGRDGKSILIGDWKDEKSALRELVQGEASWSDPIGELDDPKPLFDPADQHLIGVYALVGDAAQYRFFAPHDQAIWNAVQKAFPGQRVALESWSADHARLVVKVDSPEEGPAYALVDIAAHTAHYIGAVYPVPAEGIGPQQPISFKAQDGTPLTGYLTLPRGVEAKNLPLVVFPHGGPAARDEPGFDWWAQAMASRGYAVLQVNYRGSDGFGWTFMKAGFGQWGRAMQTDLSDGVRALAVQGKIDPKRVCIVGASYGGYAALAGATLQPDVYRCAAAIAGPSELGKFVAWSREQTDISSQRYWLRFMGADGTHDVRLEDISPADHAEQVKGPILLIHGKDDTVVPFSQSQIMADALKKAGKPYDLVVLKAEDHWLSRGETRLQMLQAVIDFLQKNNPPG